MAALTSAAGLSGASSGSASSLRYVPEVLFELDTNIEYAAKIDKILKETEGDHDA